MEKMIDNLKNIITIDIVIYVSIALACIFFLTLILMVLRRKKAIHQLEMMESSYNALKGIPLAFKLNKAVALSRVNEAMANMVDDCKNDFDDVQEMLKECSVDLAEIDDFIYGHKINAARKKMNQLSSKLASCEIQVNKINAVLEDILEQENEQRVHINALKEHFRNTKKNINENRHLYSQSYEYLETQIVSIEKMFSKFEEWMFASEFNKAADQQREIKDCIFHLDQIVEELPTLYERAKGTLPHEIDDVGYNYTSAKNKGVLLEHLEVSKNLAVISDMLKEDLNRLRNGNPEHVKEDLDECEVRIHQLAEQIQLEECAFEEVSSNVVSLFSSIRSVNSELDNIKATYNRVHERFGFENWNSKFEEVYSRLHILNDMQRKLEHVIAEESVPYSTVLIAYKELVQSTTSFTNDVSSMKEKLEKACSDEERAKKQLIRLQLIINEMRVKMFKYHLPSVSKKYEEDLRSGEGMMKEVRVVLENSPLDISILNSKLRDAIDFIYTLYNDVNNLVSMAIMVENTIVFGNRYRSSYPEIDSELTRCELCFRDGQYTKALKIGIHCIEKMHPGAYEKLINSKDPSIMNMEV